MMRAWILTVGVSLPPALAAQLPAYNLPDDPTFTFLGVAPKKVANPGTLPNLGLAVADGIDIDGRVNAGLAVAFLPSTIVHFSPAPDRYRNGTPAFWLYNTQLSLATIRASGDTGSAGLGQGSGDRFSRATPDRRISATVCGPSFADRSLTPIPLFATTSRRSSIVVCSKPVRSIARR